jgi:ferrochelatase
MARFTAASAFDHGSPERVAVLMVQLGTPDQPETSAVRRYLREFLSDPRVVEIPRLVWAVILNGIILNVRPARSAAKYASIWTEQGSPLAVHTAAQAARLSEALAARGRDVEVAWAMRYGNPSIASVMRGLRERNVTRLLVLPMYPQYAGSTTATAFDEVFRELMQWRNQPELRVIRGFHAHAPYIEALAAHIEAYWAREGRPDQLLMSFHGVPRRTLLMGDPYHCECLVTARLLATRLGLQRDRYRVTFQSRFGKAEWLQPYTDATLRELGAGGTGRLDVVCPGFVADCLETLEEIAMEGEETFHEAGGGEYRYLGCLNGSPDLAAALADLVESHTSGWPTAQPGPGEAARHEQALAERRSRALALGAQR